MTCTKGRANPDLSTKLRLFADSAGYCQRPECHQRLFSENENTNYHIAEMAHIIAAMDYGPRAKPELPEDERAAYLNLILLCPNCHTEIDKAPELFPEERIKEWKLQHVEAIKNTFSVKMFNLRDEVRAFIKPILLKNKVIFDQYGPNNSYRENPEAEEARVWKRKMLSQIIPNNKKILLSIDSNTHLLNEDELETLELFRQHVDDLIERHIGDNETKAARFPEQLNQLFVE